MMNSPSEVDQETPQSFQSSENTKEPGTKQMNDSDQLTTDENDRGEDQEDFMISLSVGDGRYLLDLGSSSEFIVDEKCMLELFKSCRECNRQCRVLKKVTGLKLEINQSCHSCGSRWKWTNLPDEDKDYLEKMD